MAWWVPLLLSSMSSPLAISLDSILWLQKGRITSQRQHYTSKKKMFGKAARQTLAAGANTWLHVAATTSPRVIRPLSARRIVGQHDQYRCLSTNTTANTSDSSSPVDATTKKTDLSDTFGRKHDYLRISLTEKCNLRCKILSSSWSLFTLILTFFSNP